MSETKFKVEIDEATGLPVVPEGFFWRVGEDYYGDPEVALMEHKLTDVKKDKKFLGIFPTGDYKYVKAMGDVKVSARGFESGTRDESKIPEGATSLGTSNVGHGHDPAVYYHYRDAVNEVTILARAIEILTIRHEFEEKERERKRREEAREAARKALSDKYYGDYPPKKLGA